jgi:hypothetical protein
MVSIQAIITNKNKTKRAKQQQQQQQQQQHHQSTSNQSNIIATNDNHSHDRQQQRQLPATKSGYCQWKREIWGGLIVLSIVYAVAYYGAVKIVQATTNTTQPATTTTMPNSYIQRLAMFIQPDSSFCPHPTITGHANSDTTDKNDPNNKPFSYCTRPDLFAFQCTAAIMQVFMAYHGLVYWHIHPHRPLRRRQQKQQQQRQDNILTTPEQRLFGKIPVAERLNVGILVFQTWDFLFSLFIPEHATAVFLLHHILTGATAYASLNYQLVHYYALYFGGCCEISSIFLVVCDYNVYFPVSSQHPAGWKLLVAFCQVAFVLTFVGYRILGWWYYSLQLWSDVQHVPKNLRCPTQWGKPSSKSSIATPAVLLNAFLTMDLVLGALQVHWFVFGMIPKIQEIFGDSST